MPALNCPISTGIELSFHGITALKFLGYPFSPGSAWEGNKPGLGVQNNWGLVKHTEYVALLLKDGKRIGNCQQAGRQQDKVLQGDVSLGCWGGERDGDHQWGEHGLGVTGT